MSDADREFKAGDRVRVIRDTQSQMGYPVYLGVVGTVEAKFASQGWISVKALSNDSAQRFLKVVDLELVTDAQTIEVGDTVKATHTAGTTVQGVVDDVIVGDYIAFGGIDIGFEISDGWTFEVVSKAVTPPKVGGIVKDAESLPVGTLVKTNEEGASILRTDEGWIDQYNYKFFDPESLHNETTIVYLPESAND